MPMVNRALLLWVLVTLGAAEPLFAYEYRIELVQHALVRLGYDAGGIDGKLAKRTRKAIRSFQEDNHLPATGEPDEETLERLMTLGGERVDPRKMTLEGVIAFINDKTLNCSQDNAFAVLPNKMSRGLQVAIQGGEVRLNTRLTVTPYEVSADELSPVNYRRRFSIAPTLTDLSDVRLIRGGETLMPACYTIAIKCLAGEDCVTEGGVYRKKATQAAFYAEPGDVPVLREAWRRLFRGLGAQEPDEFATFETLQELLDGSSGSLPTQGRD